MPDALKKLQRDGQAQPALRKITGNTLVQVYKQRVSEQKALIAKAELTKERLVLITSAFRHLTCDDNYVIRSVLLRSAEEQLPPLVRLMILAARQVVGDVEYKLIKIGLDGKKLSFLRYPGFEDDAHPELAYSVRVFLPTATYGIKNFGDSENPPLLHRKETFVDPFHPRYAEFASLSAQEEELGLLGRPDIGMRKDWQTLLKERGLQIVGHSLVTTENVFGLP